MLCVNTTGYYLGKHWSIDEVIIVVYKGYLYIFIFSENLFKMKRCIKTCKATSHPNPLRSVNQIVMPECVIGHPCHSPLSEVGKPRLSLYCLVEYKHSIEALFSRP